MTDLRTSAPPPNQGNEEDGEQADHVNTDQLQEGREKRTEDTATGGEGFKGGKIA